MSGTAAPPAPAASTGAPVASALRPGRWGWLEWLLVLWVLLPGIYFFHGSSWNQLARYDSIFAAVEPGSQPGVHLWIDDYLTDLEKGENTGDWARNEAHGPHYYSNKAPGPGLAGVPAYYFLYWGERAAGANPVAPATTQLNCYLLNLLLTVLPLALALPLFYHTLLRLRPHLPRLALLVTLALPATTLLWPYATSLWGHATAAAAVMIALWGLTRGTPRGALWAGLAGGAAVLCEYSCAIVVVALAGWLLAQRDWRRLGHYLLGGLPMLVVHALYHQLAFGSPLGLANFYNNPLFIEAGRAGGLFGGVEPGAVYGLTLSAYHGLFAYMPVLVLAGLGLFLPWRPRLRGIALVCLASIVLFLAWNLTFFGWHGGACLGPRYQIPVLPCWFVLLYLGATHVIAWLRCDFGPDAAALLRSAWLALFAVLALAAALNTFTLLAVSPMSADITNERMLNAYRRVLWFDFCRSAHVPQFQLAMWYTPSPRQLALMPADLLHPFGYPNLRHGPGVPDLPARYARFNLGELAGARGLAAIAPWLLLQGLLLAALLWRRRRRGASWAPLHPPGTPRPPADPRAPPPGW